MKRWGYICLIMSLLVVHTLLPVGEAHAAPILNTGSNNGDVWDLQYRLKELNYYTRMLDGMYGSRTQQAVKGFQSDFGLAADGIVGRETWSKLKNVTLNKAEIDMLARLIYSEARGEPYIGQVAVGAVVINRLHNPRFPHSIKGIIFQPRAFTAVDDGQYWLTPNATAYQAAWEAARGWDPTGHALFYFNPDTATSSWIWSRPQIKKIGHHIFAL